MQEDTDVYVGVSKIYNSQTLPHLLYVQTDKISPPPKMFTFNFIVKYIHSKIILMTISPSIKLYIYKILPLNGCKTAHKLSITQHILNISIPKCPVTQPPTQGHVNCVFSRIAAWGIHTHIERG